MLKFFKALRAERSDIKTLQLRIIELQMSLLPRGIRYDSDKIQTSPSDQMLEVTAKLDALERKMEAKLAQYEADKVKAITIINAMPTAKYRQLLTLRYLTETRMSWEEIAKEMDYDVVHVRGYLHKLALKEARQVWTHITTV